MGKPRMTPLAIAIRAAEPLSDEEKATLRDVLRPASKPRSKSKPERKPSQKRKVEKGATASPSSNDFCGRCGTPFDHNAHHMKQSNDYHEFQPASEASKGVGA